MWWEQCEIPEFLVSMKVYSFLRSFVRRTDGPASSIIDQPTRLAVRTPSTVPTYFWVGLTSFFWLLVGTTFVRVP
jgi:hypothetical protein